MNVFIIKQIPPSLIDGKTYFADQNGNILNAKGRKRKPDFNQAMQHHKGGSCYPVVKIANKNRNIHILFCTTFWGFPQPGQQCHHLDGNKQNTRPDNLIWLSSKEHRRYDQLVKQGIILKHTDPLAAVAEEPARDFDIFVECSD